MPRLRNGLIAGVIVVLGAGIAAWLLSNGEAASSPLQKKDRGRIKEVTPAAAPTNRIAVADFTDREEDLLKKRRELFKKMTPQERMDYLIEKVKASPLREEPSSNRIFSTGLEQALDWVFSCKLGAPPPPLPMLSLKDRLHLPEILIRDNPARETDSARAIEAKETVMLAKKEFRAYLKEGAIPMSSCRTTTASSNRRMTRPRRPANPSSR